MQMIRGENVQWAIYIFFLAFQSHEVSKREFSQEESLGKGLLDEVDWVI